MPLKSLLAPVGAFKESIANTLEGLLPDAADLAPATASPEEGLPCRSLGPALLAVLEYLQVEPKSGSRDIILTL